jgi:hypothetical protein
VGLRGDLAVAVLPGTDAAFRDSWAQEGLVLKSVGALDPVGHPLAVRRRAWMPVVTRKYRDTDQRITTHRVRLTIRSRSRPHWLDETLSADWADPHRHENSTRRQNSPFVGHDDRHDRERRVSLTGRRPGERTHDRLRGQGLVCAGPPSSRMRSCERPVRRRGYRRNQGGVRTYAERRPRLCKSPVSDQARGATASWEAWATSTRARCYATDAQRSASFPASWPLCCLSLF